MHQVRKGKYLDFTSAAVGLLSPQAVIEKQVMQHGGKLFFFFFLVCWHQIQNVHMLAILFYTYLPYLFKFYSAARLFCKLACL